MITKTFISALAMTSVLGFAGPAIAQDHMIGGKAVPADQVEAVQAKCDELRDAAAGSDAPAPDTAPAADAAATTDATTSTDTAADTLTPTTDATATTTTTDASAEAMIDLETLTIALCDEGGFTATTP